MSDTPRTDKAFRSYSPRHIVRDMERELQERDNQNARLQAEVQRLRWTLECHTGVDEQLGQAEGKPAAAEDERKELRLLLEEHRERYADKLLELISTRTQLAAAYTEAEIEAAVNGACTCGGRGPTDDCCSACEVWHRLRAANRASRDTTEQET